MTALHIAASEGHSEIGIILLQFNANPNILDKVVSFITSFIRFYNNSN